MANILFRGNVAPIQPVAVSGGSAAKGTPLTNDEGDWNYKALNDDIQTRAPIANPSFTGITGIQYNLRSVLARYNKYVAGIAGSIGSCKIGEYMPSGNSINATFIVEVIGRTTGHLAYAKAKILYRSETLPTTVVSINNEKYRDNTTDLTIEAYVDNSSGKLVLFAGVSGTLTNISFNVDVYERNADNLFSIQTSYVAKDTTGLTQITDTGTTTMRGLIVSSISGDGSGLTGVNAATATTATKLATARTINGVAFDGTANITVADSTKLPLTGGTVTGELISSATNAFRMTKGNYGVFWRNDGNDTYLMVTASGDPNGTFTAARPLVMNNATGVASINGNAATATNATYSNAASAQWTSAAINASAANSDSSASMHVRNNGGTGDAGLAAIAFNCQGAYATKIHLRADGYIGIGGWSRAAWGWYLDASNNMTAAGNVYAYSDPRLKENFKRIENPLAILDKLDGGTFNWRHGFPHIESKAGKRDYGILANQVQEVMPEIVNSSIELDGVSYLTVSYEKLVPVLIEAIRGLNARVKDLEGK